MVVQLISKYLQFSLKTNTLLKHNLFAIEQVKLMFSQLSSWYLRKHVAFTE